MFFLTLLLLLSQLTHAQFCETWGPAQQVGKLPRKIINEASGLTFSQSFKDRLYWVNDSGDKAAFYITKLDGSKVQTVNLSGVKATDTEAMSLAPCPEGHCLIIGDLGDNRRRRKTVQLVIVKEEEKFSAQVKPLRILTVQFPDGASDTEAMAVLPNGDLIFVTKELHRVALQVKAAQVFVLKKDEWQKSSPKPAILKKLGELPIGEWFSEESILGKIVTDASFNSRRKVLGLLTYNLLIEIPLAQLERLSTASKWKAGKEYQRVPIQSLPQQETLAYSTYEDRLIWSTEFLGIEPAIFSMTCTRFKP